MDRFLKLCGWLFALAALAFMLWASGAEDVIARLLGRGM